MSTPTRYFQFNFLLDLGAGTAGPQAGFQECSSLEDLAASNDSPEMTLKRGVVDRGCLQEWLNQIRINGQEYRTVKIIMQDEAHTVVQTWILLKARISRYVGGSAQDDGGDVPIEELVIRYEQMKVE